MARYRSLLHGSALRLLVRRVHAIASPLGACQRSSRLPFCHPRMAARKSSDESQLDHVASACVTAIRATSDSRRGGGLRHKRDGACKQRGYQTKRGDGNHKQTQATHTVLPRRRLCLRIQ